MATKKDSCNGKEKIGTSKLHHHIETSHGRSPRTPKSSIPTSPEKVNHGVLSHKQTPNYLKHTLSSSSAEPSSRLGKKPINSEQNSPRSNQRKSIDNPTSPTQLQKTSSSNSRDKSTPTKPSSPSPKPTISPRLEKSTIRTVKPVSERVNVSPKSSSERTSKTLRNVKTIQPVTTKSKPLRRTSSNPSSKNGSKGSPSPSIASSTAPTSPETIETPTSLKVEQNDKVILKQEVLEHGKFQEQQKEISVEVPPHSGEVLINHRTDFSEASKKDTFIEKPISFHTTQTHLEEQEHEEVILQTPHIAETTLEKTIEQVEDENQCELEKEQVMVINEDNKSIEESSKLHPENRLLASESQERGENELVTGAEAEDKMTTKPAIKLEVENEGEGTQSLKMKGGIEEEDEAIAKSEAEKLSLRRQEVNKGKKESQAYNDVIEETASKLAQKRKNKVLALVGAFETVISLQEPEGQ